MWLPREPSDDPGDDADAPKDDSDVPADVPESAHGEPEGAHEEPESAPGEPEGAHEEPESAPGEPEGAQHEPQGADIPDEGSDEPPDGATTPWMAIAEQAPQQQSEQPAHDVEASPPPEPELPTETADPPAPEAISPLTESFGSEHQTPAEPGANQWLPTDIQQEDDLRAVDAWLPEEDTGDSHADEAGRSAWLLPEPEAKPVPKTSWVPAELASESELEAFATEESTVATPAPEPSPEPAPVDMPEAAETSYGGSISADDLDEPADYRRRSKAVRAYCRELFTADTAAGVAEHILDSLSGGISDDAVLLELTRTGAAERFTRTTEARRIGAQFKDCVGTPARLAARANGTLTGREQDRLERHLGSCLVCRAMEVRAVRADRAFAVIVGLTLSVD
jgi:hypothetical protein